MNKNILTIMSTGIIVTSLSANGPFVSGTNPLSSVSYSQQTAPTFGDLDGDGDLDALIGAWDGKLYYYINNGTKKSPSFSSSTMPSGLPSTYAGLTQMPAIGDIDNDGDFDVAIARQETNTTASSSIVYYKNNGDGTFSSFSPSGLPTSTGEKWGTLTFADVDQDGDQDLFMAHGKGGGLSYYKNNGSGNFSTATAPSGMPSGVSYPIFTFGDVDGDGDLDMFHGEYKNTEIEYYRNNSGTFNLVALNTAFPSSDLTNPGTSSTPWLMPNLVDIDNDGDLDLFIGNYAKAGNNVGIIYRENSATSLSSISPSDNSTNVSIDTNLVLTFSSAVNVNSGNIYIKKTSDNTLVETIDVTSGQVTGSGSTTITINPSSDLSNGIEYYVLTDSTAFINASTSSAVTGISDTKFWSFTTVSAPSTDSDTTLTASATVTEPVSLSTTVDTVGEAVDLFDFTITDGGSGDTLSTDISQIVLNTSGTGDFSKVTWRLNGPDATNVTGAYNSSTNTITFSGLSLSITDGGNETYTVNGYFNNNTGLTEDQTFILSVDGDTDLTLDASKTQMTGSNNPITNGGGTTVDVTATKLTFSTEPSTTVVSGSTFSTQPVIKAVDESGNVDIDFSSNIILSENGAGSLGGTTTVVASSGVVTFSGISYNAVSDSDSNFTITASATGLTSDTSNSINPDVVATKLVFTTQPSPTSLQNSVQTDFVTDPVVEARDANDILDIDYYNSVTISENGAGTGSFTNNSTNASGGVATFTGLTLSHNADETFKLVATGGDSISGTSSNLTVTSNNAPVTTLPSAPTIHEDATNVAFANTIQITDGDSDNQTVTLSATNGTLSLTPTGLSFTTGDGTDDATMTFSGTLAAVNTALDSLTFSPTADYDGSASLRVQTNDGNGGTDDDTLNLSVLNAPEITSIVRGTPSSQNTNADSLTFYVYLDSNITTDATAADFQVIGTTTATVTSVTRQSIYYEVVVSGGNLASFNGSVGLKFVDDNSVLDSNGVPIGGDGIDHFTTGETYTVDNTAPTTIISNIDISADTGTSSTDFLTKTASQTITATLSTALAGGEVLYGSIDGGSNWIDITSKVSGSAISWDGATLSGTNSIKLKVTDAAGNDGSIATQSYTIDTSAPTANLTSATDNVGSVTGGLSSGDTTDDTSLLLAGTNESGSTVKVYNGTTLLGTATVTGTSWTYSATIADGTTYQFNVKETDSAGNESTATSNFTVIGDTSAPTANLTSATDNVGSVTGGLSSGDTTDDTSLLLAGTNESGSTVKVYNGTTLLGTATVTGTSWTYSATIADGTTYQFNVKETDSAGNESTATSNFTVIGDTSAPTANLTSATDNVGSVTGGLSSGDTTDDTSLLLAGTNESGSTVKVYNGTTLLGTATVSGTSWTYSATIADGTTYQFNVKETDSAGNESTATSNFTVIGDTSAPTANLTSATDNVGSVTGGLSSGDTTDDTSLLLAGTNESGSTVKVYNGTTLLGTATVTGTSWTYSATIADGTTYQFNVKETDSAGNESTATSNFTVIGDTSAPTIAITSDKDALKAGETATITFTLSEASSNFASDDVSVSGGTLTNFSGSGTSYTATFTPTADSTTNGTIDIASSKFTDAAGNNNSAATQKSITIDTVVPSVTISSSSDSLKAGETATITFTLSEASSNFASDDVSVSGGTLTNFSGSGTSYTATFTPTADSTTNGTIDIASSKFTDAAGNNNSAATQKSITIDTVVPSVTISSSSNALKAGETATITFTLSEASSNFASDDVSVSGGTLTNFSGSGTSYTATFTPTADSTTNGTIDIASSKFTDAAGNNNSAATQKVITIDSEIPSVVITTDKNSAINGEVVNLSFALSEDSSDFTVDDITVSGGTIDNFEQDNTNSKLYTAKLTIDNTTTTKTTLDISASKFEDAAGNPNNVALQKTITILPSVLTYTPSLDATDIELDSTLVLEFSEKLNKGTGNILIKRYSDDNVVETIDVTGTNVVIENPNAGNSLTNTQVTITRTVPFTLNTKYYIEIPNTSFKDVENNFYTGISSKDSWKFTSVDNHAPTITSDGGGATATLNVDENQTAVTTVVASDVDNGQTINYSISGTDAASFNIDSSTGVLTFKTAPNYEVKNLYGVTVTATDNGGNTLSDSQDLTVNINDVNDDPVITINNTLTTDEDNAKDLLFTYTDEDSNTVTASEKTAPSYGSIVISSDKITYTPNANFNGNDSFVVTLTDNNGFSVDKAISVTVNPIDDAPVITTTLDNQSENEDGKGLVISLTTTDVDNDLNTTPATYSATSSDENIATAYIQNGKLIVVPKPNANGTVTITVTTTVNGKSSTKTFTYTLVSVNDAPTISNIADISHEQSSSAINKTITFDIWDDVDVTSLSVTSSNTNLLPNSDISVSKLSSTQGELSYTISANNAGTTTVEVVAKDAENLEYKESFNINVKASNDALCVENTKTTLVFDTIKENNISQDAITSNLDLVNTIASICSSTITWSISDTSVLDVNGIVTKGTTDKTVTATANIAKGQFSTTKVFLLTIVKNAISDSEALDKLLFENIKGDNLSRLKITSKLNLLDTILGKTITWSVDDDSVISPYSGYVTRGSSDTPIVLTAKVGAETKTFNLTVLKDESTNTAAQIVAKDKELLSIDSILGENKDDNNIIYNLEKPLPSLGVNGSTITWSSSNENYITNDGDVLRDENADKYVVLTATITNGSETTTKEFILKVLQNKIETNDETTFKNASDTPTGTSVTTTNNGSDTTTEASFTNTILNIVEKVVSQDSINNIIEFAQKIVNVYLNTDGTSQSTLQNQDGTSSSIETQTKGSTTNVDDSGNVQTTNGSVTLKLNSDGTVTHEVTKGALKTTADSTISGSNVKEDGSGNVETTSEVTQGGFVYKAVVTTNSQGETTTKFVKVDLSTGEQSEVDKTISDTTPYQAGNKVEISKVNGVLYIKTTTPLDGSIVIE
ncbi:MAG: Ig-like domain-containing protein [Halarcobacter sp.]